MLILFLEGGAQFATCRFRPVVRLAEKGISTVLMTGLISVELYPVGGSHVTTIYLYLDRYF